MKDGFQPPVIVATFLSHSGVYISPEMYRDDYEETLISIAELQQAKTPGMIFVEDTLRNVHAIDVGNLASIACEEIQGIMDDSYSIEVEIDDEDDEWE